MNLTPDQLVAYYRDTLLKDQGYQQTTLGAFVRDFLAWKELEGLNGRTIEGYEHALARLCGLIGDHHPEQVTTDQLATFLMSYNPPSRKGVAGYLRQFFKWCRLNKHLVDDPTERLPRIAYHSTGVEIFTEAEIEALTQVPREPRDRVLVRILLDTGIRRAEACALQLADIDLDRRLLIVRKGKGNKARVVPIPAGLAKDIAELTILDGINEIDHLWYRAFRNRHGTRVVRDKQPTTGTFHHWWKRVVAETDVPYRHAHTCRHTFATRWLRGEEQLETLSRMLGHSSINTTSDTYSHLDTGDLQAAVERLERARA